MSLHKSKRWNMNSLIQLSFVMSVLLHVNCLATWEPQNKLKTCSKTSWNIVSLAENAINLNGNVQLQFVLPVFETLVGTKYEAILGCEGLVINGTGRQFLRVKTGEENLAKFKVHLPVPKDKEDAIRYQNDLNHSCTFELRHSSKLAVLKKKHSVITECLIRVRSFKHRILPTCDLEKSKSLIKEVQVFREQGQVQVHLKRSSNDIVTINYECRQGNVLGKHNKTATMEREMHPLSPPGRENSAMLITFSPACETLNYSMRKLYTQKRMDDCHLEVFSLCQDGLISIRKMKLQFDDYAMLCHPSKPTYIKALEELELKFRIESKPVVGLLFLLIVNGSLYLGIMPFAISKCIRFTVHKSIMHCFIHADISKCIRFTVHKMKYAQRKLAKVWEHMRDLPATKTALSLQMDITPRMEYDDMETVLFGNIGRYDEEDIGYDSNTYPHSNGEERKQSKSHHSHKKRKSVSHTKSKEKGVSHTKSRENAYKDHNTTHNNKTSSTVKHNSEKPTPKQRPSYVPILSLPPSRSGQLSPEQSTSRLTPHYTDRKRTLSHPPTGHIAVSLNKGVSMSHPPTPNSNKQTSVKITDSGLLQELKSRLSTRKM